MFIGNNELCGGQISRLDCCPFIVLQKQTPGAVIISIIATITSIRTRIRVPNETLLYKREDVVIVSWRVAVKLGGLLL